MKVGSIIPGSNPTLDLQDQADSAAVAALAARRRRRRILLVEQHVRQALRIADRVYVMDRGTITSSGPAAEIAGQVDHIESTSLSSANSPDVEQ